VNRPATEAPAAGSPGPSAAAEAQTVSAQSAPPAVTEPEPVTASDDEIAAAIARSAAQPGEPGASAGGQATVDTATPAQSATPVIAAAEAANLQNGNGQAATAAYGTAGAGEATWAPEPASTAPAAPAPQPVAPIFLQRPERPKKKSNRGFGILIALVGTIAYAILWTAAVFIVGALLTPSDEFVSAITRFYTEQYSGWAPVLAFFIGMVVLVQILNRARWWAYILGGLFVAIFVYLVYVGAAVLDAHPWDRTAEELDVVLRSVWLGAFAILAGIIAREVSVWTGAWLAGRGRKLKARNAEAQADYEQQLADAQNQAVAAYAGQQGY
jgi:hypothetical protein